MTAGDRAGKSHWDDTWRNAEVPRFDQVHSPARRNHVNREFAHFLSRWLNPAGRGARLVEFGCARSIWLPYLSNALGFSVTGVDYSARGCQLARDSLAAANARGEIVLADFFKPPAALLSAFDAAVSFGVAEHFDDTAACIGAFSQFLAPGGTMVTVVPNMTGLTGFLQKSLNRPVYDKHVPLDSQRLSKAHRQAGMTVLDSGYMISTNFGILNLEGLSTRGANWLVKRALVAALGRLSMLGWMAESHLPAVRVSAGYVYCVATRSPGGMPNIS